MNSLKNCSGAHKVGGGRRTSLLIKSLFIVVPVLFMVACGASREERADVKEAPSSYIEKEKVLADSVSSYAPSVTTETINGITHNFIRTANMKFKVKDVLSSTRKIEQIASLAGGYITNSELSATQDYVNSIHFKKDSLLEVRYFTSISNIILRVPNEELDSVLSEITNLAVNVDVRTIKANDVKLKLYANKLAENRYNAYKKRVQNKVDTKDAKLAHVTDAEDKALEKQSLADEKSIDSYGLIDQVNYSTVVLDLYQAQNRTSEIVAVSPTVDPYEPSFGEKISTAFMNGFEILKGALLFFTNFWGLFLVLFVLFFAIKKIVLHYTKKHAIINRIDQ
jgi:hypothetical protein